MLCLFRKGSWWLACLRVPWVETNVKLAPLVADATATTRGVGGTAYGGQHGGDGGGGATS